MAHKVTYKDPKGDTPCMHAFLGSVSEDHDMGVFELANVLATYTDVRGSNLHKVVAHTVPSWTPSSFMLARHLRCTFSCCCPVPAEADTVIAFVGGLADTVHAHLDTAAQLAELQQLCGGAPINFDLLEEVASDVELKQALWTSKESWSETRVEWLATSFFGLDVPAMEEQVEKSNLQLHQSRVHIKYSSKPSLLTLCHTGHHIRPVESMRLGILARIASSLLALGRQRRLCLLCSFTTSLACLFFFMILNALQNRLSHS